jgi:cell wall-associated NlpC family hydrolase
VSVSAPETTVPSVGRLLGTNNLQSSIDKLGTIVDKFSDSANTFAQATNSGKGGSSNGGSSTGSTPTGNGWAGKSNGGGASFGNTTTMSAGSANGGTRGVMTTGIGLALNGLSQYAKTHNADMTTMDYASNFLAQGTGQGISSMTGLYQNQNYAQSPSDLAGSLLQTQASYGVQANSVAFRAAQSGLATMGISDPTLSATQASQIAAGTSGWSNYYRLRMYGIQTRSATGQTMTAPQQAAALMQKMVPTKFSNMNQVSATFGQNSMTAYNLQNMGYDSDTINYMLQQDRTYAIGSMNGKSASQMDALTAQFGQSKVGSAAYNSAQKQLVGMGFTNNMLQSMKTLGATQTSRDADLLPGFSQGTQDATKALGQFKNALTSVISSIANPLGMAGGVMGVGAGALGTAGQIFGAKGLYDMLKGKIGGGSGSLATEAADTGIGAGSMGLGAAVTTVGAAAAPVITASYLDSKASVHVSGIKDKGFWGKLFNAGNVVPDWIETELGQGKKSSGDGKSGGTTTASGGGSAGPTSAVTGSMGAGKTGAAAVAVAMRFLGTKYVYGGASPQTGFDCSGLVQYSYGKIGVKLPRTAAEQQKASSPVDLTAVQIGDLIFMTDSSQGTHHVAMIAGGGNLIEAPHTGANVRMRKFTPGGWSSAGRVVGAAGTMGSSSVSGDDTAGDGSNRLSSMNFGGDVGLSGMSTNEAENVAAALGGGSAGITSLGVAPGSGSGSSSGGAVGSGTTGGAGTTASGLKGILAQAGFSGSKERVAWSVMMAESGGHPLDHNTNAHTGDNSYGLFQINMLGSLGPSRLKSLGLNNADQLFDPLTNAKAAYKISGGGDNFSAWTTYTDGAYKKYMNSYASGTWSVGGDQTANIHNNEMILNARDAQTVRQALLTNNQPSAATGKSGSTFSFGDINVTVQGVMDNSTASNAAQEIVDQMSKQIRYRKMKTGDF